MEGEERGGERNEKGKGKEKKMGKLKKNPFWVVFMHVKSVLFIKPYSAL